MALILCCIYFGCCCCLCDPSPDEPQASKPPQKSYHNQVARRSNQQAAQPLLVDKRVEGVVVDGVAVLKEVTTVAGITESGRVAVVENEKLIVGDGTNAVLVGEKIRVAKYT